MAELFWGMEKASRNSDWCFRVQRGYASGNVLPCWDCRVGSPPYPEAAAPHKQALLRPGELVSPASVPWKEA